MTLNSKPANSAADHVLPTADSGADAASAATVGDNRATTTSLVGNPRRTRGVDASDVAPPAPVTPLVGNPRRTRGIDPDLLAG